MEKEFQAEEEEKEILGLEKDENEEENKEFQDKNNKEYFHLLQKYPETAREILRLSRSLAYGSPGKIEKSAMTMLGDLNEVINEKDLRRLIYAVLMRTLSVKQRRAKPHSKFGTLLAISLYSMLGCDTFFLDDVIVLHALNFYSRTSFIKIVESLSGSSTVGFLTDLRTWGKLCHNLVTDQGPEFANSEVLKFCDQNRIAQFFTSGKAHWSLGKVEVRHYAIKNLYAKISLDPYFKSHTKEQRLKHVISAINEAPNSALQGLSPYQLDNHGQLPPSTRILSLDEEVTFNPKKEHDYLKDLKAVQKAQLELEQLWNCQNFQRELQAFKEGMKASIRKPKEYQTGDMVDYRDENEWNVRPGKVLGVEKEGNTRIYHILTSEKKNIKRNETQIRAHIADADLLFYEAPTQLTVEKIRELEKLQKEQEQPKPIDTQVNEAENIDKPAGSPQKDSSIPKLKQHHDTKPINVVKLMDASKIKCPACKKLLDGVAPANIKKTHSNSVGCAREFVKNNPELFANQCVSLDFGTVAFVCALADADANVLKSVGILTLRESHRV